MKAFTVTKDLNQNKINGTRLSPVFEAIVISLINTGKCKYYLISTKKIKYIIIIVIYSNKIKR